MRSENEEKEKFLVDCIQVLRDKLPLITLNTDWLIWFSSDNCARFFLAKMDNRNICVAAYFEVNSFLSLNVYLYGQRFFLSS